MIELYTLFALSGGILSTVELYLPVVEKLKAKRITEHPFVSNTVLSGLLWFVGSVLIIPFFIKALIFEKDKQQFIAAVYDAAISQP
jgi:hypothetical protein